MDALHLAPRPDFDALQQRLRTTGRVHIPHIFPDAIAQALSSALIEETEWTLVLNGGETIHDLRAAQLSALKPHQFEQFADAVEMSAREEFQYVHDAFRIDDAVEKGAAAPQLLRDLYLFVNSPPFLEFAKSITGDERMTYVDMQATRYRPGHFLTTHTDEGPGKNRLYAYVFNLTPMWRVDWGGILLFSDKNGRVVEGFPPAFNALNILKVPTPHSVSMVTPSAVGARYSFTGWMRAIDPPPKIPGQS